MPRTYTRPQERQRRQIRTILDRSPIWAAATMKISPDGAITAEKDPAKTMRSEAGRHHVGHVEELIGETYASKTHP